MAILFIIAWLACGSLGFYFFQRSWRREYDFALADAFFGVTMMVLAGPIFMIVGIGMAVGSRLNLNIDTVVLPRYPQADLKEKS